MPPQFGPVMINVAVEIIADQGLIAGKRCGDRDLLRAPVWINANRGLGKTVTERMAACAYKTLGVGIAAGGGAEWKQAQDDCGRRGRSAAEPAR